MALATGGIRFNVFTQSSASNVWNINHNLGSKPLVDINAYDNGILQKAFPLSIIHPDDNNVVINWSSPRSGFVSIGNSIAPDPSSAGYQHTVVYTAPGVTPPGPGAWSGAIVVNNPVGTIDALTGWRSATVPGVMLAPDPYVPGTPAFTLLDNFTNNSGSNDGRAPDSSSISGLKWIYAGVPNNGDAGTVSGGNLLLTANYSTPMMADYINSFGYANGAFLEFQYSTLGLSDSGLIIGLSIGGTNLQVAVTGTSCAGALAGTICATVSGYDGYLDVNSAASISTDSFYSSVADYRDQIIRAELTNSTVKVTVGGTMVIYQPLRFSVSTSCIGTGPILSVTAGYTSEINALDYLSIGAL